jgi:hypothetical protein
MAAMRIRSIAAVLLLAHSGAGCSAAWSNYRVEVAPGFAVERRSSFLVCLAGPAGRYLTCPDSQPEVGPLVEYAVTGDAIVTKHLGSQAVVGRPELVQIDPTQEFFFHVRRSDEAVAGPYTRADWQQEEDLPALSSLAWMRPRNPSFWVPLLGDLFMLGFFALYVGWPVIAAISALWVAFALYRKLARSGHSR